VVVPANKRLLYARLELAYEHVYGTIRAVERQAASNYAKNNKVGEIQLHNVDEGARALSGPAHSSDPHSSTTRAETTPIDSF
jgi:hypothetical protein